ncbi:MAG TPA: lamin tail domain-containing protein, partial [Candidatus Paceibacterota bacterium]|nr:lamin tail domain-containing protein [Candidatus Paceibacterota bacterium]
MRIIVSGLPLQRHFYNESERGYGAEPLPAAHGHFKTGLDITADPSNTAALRGIAGVLLSILLLAGGCLCSRADSVIVFNEIMYHPGADGPAIEWIELHNQMAVAVDLTGWSITGGVNYSFPNGTTMAGGDYLVVSSTPFDQQPLVGLTNIFGPFQGRLSNAGDSLELRNNNHRVMDKIEYGVEGDWPVGPDGSGVSLAKRNEDFATEPPWNWTSSAQIGGTPGRRNFPENTFVIVQTTPVDIDTPWRFLGEGGDPGIAWRQSAFDDTAWAHGQGLFKAGNPELPLSEPQSVPTLFNSGTDSNHQVLAPGSADPHYLLTQSAMGAPPPPSIAAIVIENHPAWAANDSQSSWIGPLNPGTANVAAGAYHYRTQFSLDGFDPSTCVLTLMIGADNRLNDVRLNGASRGLSYVGFSTLSSPLTLSNGFVDGLNTLDFLTVNDDTSANPAGFRVQLSATARARFLSRTTLADGPVTRYLRARFLFEGAPQFAALELGCVLAGGAVFYLNDSEILRLNLPPGPLSGSTLALPTGSSPLTQGPFSCPTSALLAGTNVLAVELHSSMDHPADMLFGASLSLTATNVLTPPPIPLAFNECSSTTNNPFWIELINISSNPLDLSGCVLSRPDGTTNREYVCPRQVLSPGEFLVLNKALLGFDAEPGDRLFLYAPGRASLIDAIVAQREPRGRWPDGTGTWQRPASLTPGASNHVVLHQDVVINEIMYHPPSIASAAAQPLEETLLPLTARWRYEPSGADPETGWFQPAFDDRAWPQGNALMYVEDAALPAAKNTPLKLGPTTFYFRTSFVFEGNTNGLELCLGAVVDDGAVFYLNGQEVSRINMPDGPVDAQTFASPSVGDATYLGPIILPISPLLPGTNLLAVEVHQASANSSDVVFGAELLARYSATPPPITPDADESWIELHNRGSQTVDLAGWQLTHDIEYVFGPNTVITPGGYLVIAKDVESMQSSYPGIPVLGPFSKRLSRSEGRLRLLDALGNPADELRYFDSKPWPDYADGGGSSLELRDPWADNSKAEAWAASLESQRSEWVHYTYRGTARNVLGPTQWREFVLGLLDAGECLIDDLSVVENPSGTPVQLLQNGNFETGFTAWRALGNHRHSYLEPDPDHPGNRVLHLVATGPTEHMHNHLETTLASNRSVVDGREYEVSYRAKWLAGNRHLNTRLYFNRVAKTTALALPRHPGTPGARNSTFLPNTGPTYQELGHYPVLPKPGEPVVVRIRAHDIHGISDMTLRWAINGGSWRSTPMTPDGAPTDSGYTNYVASLAGNPAGTGVQFYVQGTDRLGAVSTFPAGGTNSRAIFKVESSLPALGRLHRLRLWMTPSEAAWLHAPTNVMSNDRLGLTVVYNDREVFYDVGVHLQGSERGRNDSSRVGFTLRFQADHLFRGIQNSLAADKSGGYSGLGGKHDEILLWHAINHAGGLPGMYNDLAQILAPRSQENGTALLRLAAYGSEFLDNQYANGSDGPLYKLELIYYPTTTATGDPQAPKLPQPDNVINMDLQNWGADPENYRWIFRQENRNDNDDHSLLIALNQALSLSGAAFESQTSALMDVDEWMRALAFLGLIGAGDMFTYGLNHNFLIYFRPEDQKAMAFLFDMDYQFVQPVTSSFPGSGSQNIYRLTMLPNNYRRYCHHLLSLIHTT